MKKLVSIIIPVYNVEHYLGHCLDSLLDQTYENIEILAIDDGSKDSSLQLLYKYAAKDRRIHVLTQANSGPSAARNLGLSKCRGDYITFADSDDWVEMKMIERLVEAMEKDESDIAICGHWISYPHFKFKVCNSKPQLLNQKQAVKMILEDKIIKNYAWGKMYRRTLLPMLYFPVNQIYEDVRSIYKVFLQAERFSLLGEPLYYYRMRQGSITYSLPANNASEMKKAYQEQRHEVAKIYPDLIGCTDMNLYKATFLICYTAIRDKLLMRKTVKV